MRNAALLKLLAALASGALLGSAFPPWGWEAAVWIWALPLLAALWLGQRDQKAASAADAPAGLVKRLWHSTAVARKPFLLGWIAGLACYLPSLSWVRQSSRVIHGAYGDEWMGWGVELLGWSAAFGLAAYCALYVGLWAAFADTIARPRREQLGGESRINTSLESLRCAFLAAAAWVALEWVRGWFLSGFGWNGLGVGLHNNKLIIQAADLVGVTGLSFTPMFLCCIVFLAGWRIVLQVGAGVRLRHHFDVLCAVGLIGAQMVYGISRLNRPAPKDISLRVALVQQNIPQVDRWTASPEKVLEIYRRYSDLTELYAGARDGKPSATDLVVWPESGLLLPWYHPDHSPYLNQLLKTGTFSLITGADVDEPTVGVFNSAVLLRGSVDSVQMHHKLHLVPFGEYVPGRDIVPGLQELLGGILPGDLTPGTSSEPLRLEQPQVDIIPLICFEDTVGRVARQFVRSRPQVLVNLTNDGWFLQTVQPELHLQNALFRAIELRRPMCRAANTGVSAFIDERGVVTSKLVDPETGSHFIQGVLPGVVNLSANPEITLYARWGDWFAVTMLVVCLAAGGASRYGQTRATGLWRSVATLE